ncbi:hypothetical protein GYMLUDRAFT_45895 [Collybiopsis luxurians FD-317 M1]|uniref:GYF domain-containing protein n=1 Tax=Collybiopsis luxurians FD-317 M1 TaxID=944289 RepID=A0A0D0C5E2_9AGAR|nr:hypothetical protein GYMLUDRAFT_45895 [Collybiopsis luxurians FD-317 M1]
MPPLKRPTEDPSSSSQRAPPSKKTRFVEPGDDPATFAEQVDSALENPSANRKGRVKNEGYESDSSDDGEGVVLSRKKGAENDEDDDIFAVADKEEKAEESGAKKKKETYIRLGDIEGQEFGHSGSEDEDDEDEPEDEDDAERKKKAGMGYELSSFNMREEMEEGKFTEDGSYVRSFDPHGIHDRWMEGLDEKEIKQARKRKREQERIQKERMEAEEKELEESGGKPALEKELLAMLKKGETVLESLQRLGVEAKKANPKSKQNANETAMNVDASSKAPSDIERVTHLASTIMSLGEADIYSKTYEELVRSVRSSGTVDTNWVSPSADKKYEYKWDVPGSGQVDQTFGPFDEEEMKSWFKASYFGPSGEKVKVRQVGGEWKDWDELL